jgi:hypothetical protein
MKWFLLYLAIGLVAAIISYRLQRRDRNMRKARKKVGALPIVFIYMWLWPAGIVSDLVGLARGRREKE